ncbi:MAG: CDP-alcohol phosphatidyltransferase family protein [Candidatus Cyclobacteriaceae bacterium M3_2C_046]
MNLKNLNTAEKFAISRTITFPILLILIFTVNKHTVAWFYLILWCTDFIDGFFAKFFNMESARRAKLDSLGDILFLLVGMVGFIKFEYQFFAGHLIWILLVVGLYLIVFIMSLIKFKKPTNFHSYLAKVAALVLVVFLSHSFFFSPSPLLFYFAVVISLLDALDQIILVLMLKHWQANIKGIWELKIKKNRSD